MARFYGRPQPALAPRLTNRWLALPAGVMLLAALAIGLLLAINLPGLVAAGFPDKGLNRELTQAFGYSEWPELVRKIARFVAILVGLTGTMILLIARRRSGAAHVGRAMLGAIGLAFAASALMQSCAKIDWFSIVALFESEQPGRGLDTLFDRINPKGAAMSGLLLVGSTILLMWPEHREPLAPVVREGHAG
jgi:hypothetical protein